MMIQILSLTVVAIAFAIPTFAQDKSGFTLHLPKGSDLKIPQGQTLKLLTIGIGTQNYTCASGAWKFIGALSDLRDLSGDVSVARTLANDLMKGGKSNAPRPDVNKFPVVGKHFFAGPPGKESPVFQTNKGQITATKKAGTPSPLNSQRNVDWLQLTTTTGDFAKTVFRTTTRGGKPPTTPCKGTEKLEVKYAALYTFWG